MPKPAIYAASKYASFPWAKTLSGELISRGIRVNAICPGPIATPLLSKTGMSKEELDAVNASLRKQIPTGRFGDAAQIARAIVFLASGEAAFTLGSKLVIDGGISTL